MLLTTCKFWKMLQIPGLEDKPKHCMILKEANVPTEQQSYTSTSQVCRSSTVRLKSSKCATLWAAGPCGLLYYHTTCIWRMYRLCPLIWKYKVLTQSFKISTYSRCSKVQDLGAFQVWGSEDPEPVRFMQLFKQQNSKAEPILAPKLYC